MNRPNHTIKNIQDLIEIIRHCKKYNVEIPVYYVHALGYASFNSEYIIKGNYYIDYGHVVALKNHNRHVFCPGDANVKEYSMNSDRNGYNDHFLFLNKEEADNYVALCKKVHMHETHWNDYDYYDIYEYE